MPYGIQLAPGRKCCDIDTGFIAAVMSVVGTALFALSATRAHASYDSFVMYFMLASVGGGMAYVAWIASFTETVEKRNPAATPVGLAVWGWTLRLVVTVSLIALTQA